MRRRTRFVRRHQSPESNGYNTLTISTILEAASIAGAFPAISFLVVGEQRVVVDQPYRLLVPFLLFFGLSIYGGVVACAAWLPFVDGERNKRRLLRRMQFFFLFQLVGSVSAVTTLVWAFLFGFYSVVPSGMD